MLRVSVENILKAIRGDKDQRIMDQLLGLSANSYHRFETGYKIFRLSHLFEFSDKLGEAKTVLESFDKVLSLEGHIQTEKDLLDYFLYKWGDPGASFVNDGLEISETTWWRIKNNKTSIPLDLFLSLIEHRSGKLKQLLSEWNKSFQMFDDFDLENQQKLHFLKENPDFTVLTAAMDIQHIRNSKKESLDEFLIRVSDMEKDRYFKLKSQMIALGICEFSEDRAIEHLGKLEFREEENNLGRSIVRYIGDSAVRRSPKNNLRMSYLIKAVSSSASKEIAFKLRESYQEIQKILEEDEAKTKEEILHFTQVAFVIPDQ